ncbi:Hypothetical predicted protein [Pelobates cultripes]|uniref:Uncharacterized protein n=1 Tax=Pelobates cultripes TaxID=61616 RepID=A0AAD1WEI0_PELCU|nr:Hypothetical predicted protein [Pelobates cultripes]
MECPLFFQRCCREVIEYLHCGEVFVRVVAVAARRIQCVFQEAFRDLVGLCVVRYGEARVRIPVAILGVRL